MSFFDWLLTQRQHPTLGTFAIWAWSEQSPIPRRTQRLHILLTFLDGEHVKWRDAAKRAHKKWREERKQAAA